MCTVEGLRYVRWFRAVVLPWSEITDVLVLRTARVNASELSRPGHEVTIVCSTRILCGNRLVLISNRSSTRQADVEHQVARIRDWHDRFASLPLAR